MTTGYSWHYVKPDANNSIFSIESDEHIQDEAPPGFCGAPGNKVIVIRAKEAGKTKFQMIYVRPWEAKVEGDLSQVANAGYHEIPIEITQ